MPLCLTWGQHFWPAGTEGGNLLLTKYWRMNLTSLLQLFVWTFLGQISSLYFCSTKFSFMWFNFSSLYWFSSASRIIDVLETLLNNKTIFQNCVSFWLSLNFTRKTEKMLMPHFLSTLCMEAIVKLDWKKKTFCSSLLPLFLLKVKLRWAISSSPLNISLEEAESNDDGWGGQSLNPHAAWWSTHRICFQIPQ